MRIVYSRAKEYARLSAISDLSWSTSPSGLNAYATSSARPLTWYNLLSGLDEASYKRFLSRMSAASESALVTDTLTAVDYAAHDAEGHPRRGYEVIPYLVSLPYAKFRFLVTVGHCSSMEGQEALVGTLLRNLPSMNPGECDRLTQTLTAVRATLGEHAENKMLAPHYVADVVSLVGVSNVIKLYGGAR